MSINRRLLQKDAESKWCRTCQQYQVHIGALCSGCTLDEEDVGWYIENVESQKTADNKPKPPEPPKPLNGVEKGDTLYLSSGATATVTEITSRSVKTDVGSFVKSDGTGWGSNETDAAPYEASS